MKLKLNLLILFSTFSLFSYSQENVKIAKSEFKDIKEGFKDAWDNIKTGEDFYEKGKTYYKKAHGFYLKAYAYNKDNAELNYKIGVCYLFSDEKSKAESYLLAAYNQKNLVSTDIQFLIGRAYHINNKFEQAIRAYSTYLEHIPPKEVKTRKSEVEHLIEQCKNGKELITKPVKVLIENLGDNINSPYSDYNPLISANETCLIFTSRREGTTGNKINPFDNSYYEDIYVSYKEGETWQKAVNIGVPINTEANEATVGLSPDGQELFIYRGDVRNGDIFVSRLKGNKWTLPKQLPNTINTKYHEAAAAFSPDGNTMYFVSNRNEVNFGGHDIYKSEKNDKGKWQKPINLGNVINTEYDEMGVFMHPDGKTLYFSSKGHNSMGGFDIFKTVFNSEKNEWSKPENLGYPINTSEDDLFFVLSADGKRGYYTAVGDSTRGGRDIYQITFLHPDNILQSNEDNLLSSVQANIESKIEEVIEVKRTVLLTVYSGRIFDVENQKAIEATLEVVDNKTNKLVGMYQSNSETGNYLISLPAGKNYGITVKAKGYLFLSENEDLSRDSSYHQVAKNFELQKVSEGSKMILNNIFFDTGKSTLKPESMTELNTLVKMLKENSKVSAEISGHSDNVGNKELNHKLSEERAKSVMTYLIKKGIKANRLKAVGMGDSQAIASNDTEEGRKKNRRVEFKILGK